MDSAQQGAAAGLVPASPPSVVVRLPLEPWAQERPRLTTVGGFARAFDPPRSRAWKKVARQLLAETMAGRSLLTGPLSVSITAVSTCPPSQHRRRVPQPRRWNTSPRLDWDNIGKIVCDAMQGVVFANDGQIARGTVERIVGAQGEAPGVSIEVRPLGSPLLASRVA